MINEFKMRCPGCGGIIIFCKGKLPVNIESEGSVDIPKFMVPLELCDNPFCKWSKVENMSAYGESRFY